MLVIHTQFNLYYFWEKRWFFLAMALGAFMLTLPLPEGLSQDGMIVLAMSVVATVLFVTEPVPLPTVALLMEVGHMEEEWDAVHTHTDVWGDPLGDNKIEYRHENGKSIVLKLKTAPDVVSGILDQYELGPYNLMTLGEPSRWQGEIRSFWDAGVAQKVAMLSPCSGLVAREGAQRSGYLICTDGSEQSLDAARRAAVLARYCDSPITLFSVTPDHEGQPRAEEVVARAKAMLEDLDIPVADTAVGVGDPVDQIVEAGAGHAVIVVSDSGKSRLKRFLVGSVAFGVMGRAKTSVLNVR